LRAFARLPKGVFRGDPHLFAQAAFQRFAQNGFAVARVVTLRGIEIIDALCHGITDQFVCLFPVNALGQIRFVDKRQTHTTHTQQRSLEARITQFPVLHGKTLLAIPLLF
jgi:hypothetical protein